MGLEDADLVDDGNAAGGGKAAFSVPCSICLEVVTDNGDRAWAKLQCGHQFHLDCIGSAFNVKGVMQCPNCRRIEKGQWLFANGCRTYPEFSRDDWAHDEDLYDPSYSESDSAFREQVQQLRQRSEQRDEELARMREEQAGRSQHQDEELARMREEQATMIQHQDEELARMRQQLEELYRMWMQRGPPPPPPPS